MQAPLSHKKTLREKIMMSVIVILEVANLFFAGLLSGAEYVVRYGVRVPLNVLDVQPQLQFRQANHRLFQRANLHLSRVVEASRATEAGINYLLRYADETAEVFGETKSERAANRAQLLSSVEAVLYPTDESLARRRAQEQGAQVVQIQQ